MGSRFGYLTNRPASERHRPELVQRLHRFGVSILKLSLADRTMAQKAIAKADRFTASPSFSSTPKTAATLLFLKRAENGEKEALTLAFFRPSNRSFECSSILLQRVVVFWVGRCTIAVWPAGPTFALKTNRIYPLWLDRQTDSCRQSQRLLSGKSVQWKAGQPRVEDIHFLFYFLFIVQLHLQHACVRLRPRPALALCFVITLECKSLYSSPLRWEFLFSLLTHRPMD